MNRLLLDYRDVSLSYDSRRVAVSQLRFHLYAGEALALIGPNGSGKSTLLKSILGLISPVHGSAQVLGGSARAAAGQIGYLPQHESIDLDFPVSLREVVLMGRFRALGPWRWPGRADQDAVARALRRVDLSDAAQRRFGDLSGGQRQRALLARALVADPAILLLDEPFNGLDTPARAALMHTLRELRDDGIGIVLSTHDFELADQVCSHALLLNREQIAYGPVGTTLTPATLTATFGEGRDALAHPEPRP